MFILYKTGIVSLKKSFDEQHTNTSARCQQMEQKINRMAWELYEQNHNEKNIIIAGIAKRGYVLAERIASILSEISNIH